MLVVILLFLLEGFRLEDDKDYEYEIWLKVYRVFSRKVPSRKPHFTFDSPEKLALLSLLKEVQRLMTKLIKLIKNAFSTNQSARYVWTFL